MNTKERRLKKIEEEIISRAVRDTMGCGYSLSVTGEDGQLVLAETRLPMSVVKAVMEGTKSTIYLHKNSKGCGWVCVHRGQGTGILHDWTPNIENMLEGALMLGMALTKDTNF